MDTPNNGPRMSTPLRLPISSEQVVHYESRWKYIQLIFHALAILVCAAMYVNWIALGPYFLKHGLYSWKCESTSAGIPLPRVGQDEACPDQLEAISRLPVYATSASFSCALIGGIIKDKFGSGRAYQLGSGMIATSMAILGATQRSPGTEPIFDLLPFVFLLWGAAAEILILGLLGIQFEFPGREATIITIIASVRSLSLGLGSFVSWMDLDIWTFGIAYAITICLYACGFSSSSLYSKGIETGRGLDDMTPHSRSPISPSEPVRDLTSTAKKSLFNSNFQLTRLGSLTVYYAWFCLSMSYIIAATPMIYKEENTMRTLLADLIPFSGVIGAPIVGLFTDSFGTWMMPFFMATSQVILLVGAVWPSHKLAQLCVIVSALFLYSCRNSQIYVLSCSGFHHDIHGLIIGLTFLVGGLFAILSFPILHLVSTGYQAQIPNLALALATFLAYLQLHMIFRRVDPKKISPRDSTGDTTSDVTPARRLKFFEENLEDQSDQGVLRRPLLESV